MRLQPAYMRGFHSWKGQQGVTTLASTCPADAHVSETCPHPRCRPGILRQHFLPEDTPSDSLPSGRPRLRYIAQPDPAHPLPSYSLLLDDVEG